MRFSAVLATVLFGAATPVAAAEEAGIRHLEGADLGLLWALPFAGILLSIAIGPLAAPKFWHHHFGKVSAFWSLCVVVPFLVVFGFGLTLYELIHLFMREYLPFIILLFSLFTVAGGVRITGALRGTPSTSCPYESVIRALCKTRTRPSGTHQRGRRRRIACDTRITRSKRRSNARSTSV